MRQDLRRYDKALPSQTLPPRPPPSPKEVTKPGGRDPGRSPASANGPRSRRWEGEIPPPPPREQKISQNDEEKRKRGCRQTGLQMDGRSIVEEADKAEADKAEAESESESDLMFPLDASGLR